MSRAPSTIHIKRKATDDPVDVLRVHELNGKRQRRATEFVFTRQSVDTPLSPSHGSTPNQLPPGSSRRIKPLPRSSVQTSASSGAPETDTGTTPVSSKQRDETRDANNLTPQLELDDDLEITPLQISQHRRFHISRASSTRGRQSPVIGGKIQKRSPTILVERRPGTPTSRTEKSRAKAESYTSNTTPTAAGPAEETRRQKKPGRSARTTPRSTSQPAVDHLAPSATTRDRNVRLPSGLVTPWDVTSEQLVKELEAYTLEEIGRNMAEADAMAPKPPPAPQPLSQSNTVVSLRIKKGASSKFKPKVPAQRYHERHPEVMAPPTVDEPEQDQTDDDGDFVIDTYVRMPAEEVDVNDKNHIGYIVLEDQPDIDEFYEEDEQQNEDEEEYDEDDENAENHYTADYPDEEVDSDDEYDRNAYRYRTGNASDEEEFDENDYDEMDEDGDDSTRYPWLKSSKPSWMRKADQDDEDFDDEEDDADNDEADDGQNEGDDHEVDGESQDQGKDEVEKIKDEDEDMKDAHDVEVVHTDAKLTGARLVEADSGSASEHPKH